MGDFAKKKKTGKKSKSCNIPAFSGTIKEIQASGG